MIVSIHREDARGNVYTLMEEQLTVPAGFESDGASVPRFFWRIIFPPGDPKAIRAAFKHDYIYRCLPAGWTRKDTDKIFRRNLLEDGVKRWKANLAYVGLRLFGFASFGRQK